MNNKRIICGIICMAIISFLVACGSSEEPNEIQAGNTTGQGPSQSGVQMQRPISEDFDTLGQLKRFFSISMDSSEISTDPNDVKCVNDYYTQTEAVSISDRANSMFIPVVKQSVNAEGFSASWSPEAKHLTIIYRIDGVQYRFVYFFADHYPWVFEEPVSEDVQVGPYTIDFEAVEHGVFDSCFHGGIQIAGSDAYLSVRVLGNGVERPTYDDFDFIPLSSIGGDIVE